MPVPDPGTAFCLERVGKSAAGWGTLVVSGAADTVLPAENLWAVWADLEHWPMWSPMHRSVTRAGPGALAAGVSFDQQISLGFPVGTTTQHVTIAVLEPARRAAWAGDAKRRAVMSLVELHPHKQAAAHASATPRRSPAFRSECCARWSPAGGTAPSRSRSTASSAAQRTARGHLGEHHRHSHGNIGVICSAT